MTGAETLVAMLRAYQVNVVFGLPGDTSVALYDALARQEEVRHVMARDERAAGFMADAYARLRRTPGVCEGPSGGGATYMLPAVAEAHHSSIPLLAITTDNALPMEHRGALTALDQEALYRPVVKWTATVKRADLIPHLVRRAFRLMTSGRPGAVHLSFPKDVLEAQVTAPDLRAEAACVAAPSYRTRPDGAAVAAAAALLRRAERPVMICGGGVHLSSAYAEVRDLAERLAMPVATSINGKGSLSERHPLSLGVTGANGGRPFVHEAINDSDLLLVVGSRANYVTTNDWRAPSRDYQGAIIQVDVDAAEVGNNLRVDAGLVGDAALALRDLASALAADPGGSRRDRSDAIRRAAEAWRAAELEKARSSEKPIKPQRVIQAIADLAPAGAVIVADPGTPTPFIAAQYAVAQAGRFTIIPRAHGGLGYALPASLGASLAVPGAPVVCLTGDGSFGFSAGELETIARLGQKIVVVQFSNGTFGWIKALQHAHHGGRYFGVDFRNQDCAAIARAFGWAGARVTEPGDVHTAIGAAFASSRPAFVDIVTADAVEEPPPVTAWRGERG
jgi:acetolactate synthase-1/2/3 large subunit